MARLLQADRTKKQNKKPTVTQITTHYNHEMQKSISERTARASGGLQQKTTLGTPPLSEKQETEAATHIGSPTLDDRLEKRWSVPDSALTFRWKG